MAESFVTQFHPLYETWKDTWTLLGEAFEGDGGFLDGSNLVAHPREVNYGQHSDGSVDYDTVVSEKQKFIRRKAIARYENFARTIVQTFIDYLCQKTPTRTVGTPGPTATTHPLEEWWLDVDGLGTHIDDWMKRAATLAAVYGHVFVVLDRERLAVPAQTQAEQATPFVRLYTPLDTPDWLAPHGKLTAVRFIEAVGRASLMERVTDDEAVEYQHRIWTETDWSLYDDQGKPVQAATPHNLGELPVLPLFCQRRARLPMIGQPLLPDPRLFKDHFNLLSELRELLRGQTFSMLHVELAEGQDLADAKGLLGPSAGVETVSFSRGGMAFIAPPAGPAVTYQEEVQALERKMYRLTGLPWESDSREIEAAESRRLKAMDLNRLLSGIADECEQVDYALARLWFKATYGAEAGQTKFDEAKLTIRYPDEFHTEQLLQALQDAQVALGLKLGPTASRMIRERVVPLVLPDLSPEDAETISQEIKALPTDAPSAAGQFRADLLKAVGQTEPAPTKPAEAAA
jgi:hypothetical protein